MNDHGTPAPREARVVPAGDALRRLIAANIDPATGLSTDYLNHFGEAIMLLDLTSQAPEYGVELARWRPLTYREYFAASQLQHRALSIAAYDAADPQARGEFDALCGTMSAVILASTENPITAAAESVTRLKALFARASAVVHGLDAADANAARLAPVRSLIDAAATR